MEKRREEVKHLHTAFFTMLIALLMLCFQRAHILAPFAERWRARIFILLNLILLAVLVTSLYFTRAGDDDEGINRKDGRKKKFGGKRRRLVDDMHVGITCCKAEKSCKSNKKTSCNKNDVFVKKADDDDDDEFCDTRVEEEWELLSEEELNRRVEAFITMFREQLVSDSRRKSRFVSATTTPP